MFRLTSGTDHVRTLSRFCLWRPKPTRIENVVRPPACAWGKRRGLARQTVGAFEAMVELLDAHPRFPGGAPLMTRRTASDNSDRSSRCVENDGSKRRQEPRSVCVALGADRRGYQASRAGNARVANPAGRPVEVSGVYGLCERCGRRHTKGVRGPYKGRISRWR